VSATDMAAAGWPVTISSRPKSARTRAPLRRGFFGVGLPLNPALSKAMKVQRIRAGISY
jgi:hypothetical protein